MVFFTCNHCGESVKKPAVEKHYNTRCRGAVKNVSCMDCLKDFRGDEYAAHTKCITEAEKYSGKDYVPKENKNSGAKKQESWMDTVRAILDSSEHNLSASARNAFQRLQNVDNVPRKKAKFQNFVANCMRMPKSLSEEVWNVLEREQEKIKQSKQQEVQQKDTKPELTNGKITNGVTKQLNGVTKAPAVENNDSEQPPTKKPKKKKANNSEPADASHNNVDEPVPKKSKKNKTAENKEAEAVMPPQINGKKENAKESASKQPAVMVKEADTTMEKVQNFEWISLIEDYVAKQDTSGIPVEKLKKRLQKKFKSYLGLDEMTEKQINKFDKKFSKSLKKCTTVQVEGEIVKPCRC